MSAKKTVKNQIALPRQMSRADEVRARLSQLGIEEKDVDGAISSARETKLIVGTEQ